MSEEQTIKAIPTKYKGYTFRSRLEAKWAVWMDTLKLAWDYEQEGYELTGYDWDEAGNRVQKKIWYLPDFWIPEWDCFIEVKPRGAPTEEAAYKARLLSIQMHKLVLILAGNPWPEEYEVFIPSMSDEPTPGCFVQSDADGQYWIRSTCGDKDWGVALLIEPQIWHLFQGHYCYEFSGELRGLLPEAFEAARSVRFERH